jgi:2-beta-glucuronyltransferase
VNEKPTGLSLGKPPVAVLFTQQFVGLNTRKTGMVFWAEALARQGFDTYAVTVQLSMLSLLGGAERLRAVPKADRNVWRQRGERLSGFVWIAPLHPARFGRPLLNRLAAPAYRLYGRFLPPAVREVVRRADLIVVESCSAVLLFETLKALAPAGARFVYCASDRLGAVGMHPMLEAELDRTAARYDLVRVPSRAMLDDFPAGTRAVMIPHGIDKTVFETPCASPFDRPGPHVVVAGDMLFDGDALRVLLDGFPDVTFHAFGRMRLDDIQDAPNLVVHGEVPFPVLATYLRNADVGFAPYLDRPEAHYVAESSLKLIQYTYCRLPVVAPHFVAAGRPHVCGYDTGDADSLRQALVRALAMERGTIDTSGALDWGEVIGRVRAAVGLAAG